MFQFFHSLKHRVVQIMWFVFGFFRGDEDHFSFVHFPKHRVVHILCGFSLLTWGEIRILFPFHFRQHPRMIHIKGNKDLIFLFSFPETWSSSHNMFFFLTHIRGNRHLISLRLFPSSNHMWFFFSYNKGNKVLTFLEASSKSQNICSFLTYTEGNKGFIFLLAFPETSRSAHIMWFLSDCMRGN